MPRAFRNVNVQGQRYIFGNAPPRHRCHPHLRREERSSEESSSTARLPPPLPPSPPPPPPPPPPTALRHCFYSPSRVRAAHE
uniref:Uncharacterized protein n=1 Tax=Vespula pensylvanica TaxID=30213 RepID=A0A834P0C4_VESPE|nr:hypothetical protein H0235_008758 [Vespula pensylvanica]